MSKKHKLESDVDEPVPLKEGKFEKDVKTGPNILITGTPGVGKSALCKALKDKDPEGIQIINIGSFAKENNLLGIYDEDYECHELDEDKIVDNLEKTMQRAPANKDNEWEMGEKRINRTVIIDHQVTDFFPERWFDIIFVLRTDNTTLYDRIGEKGRGYSGKKLQDNIECEIFQTILDEAKENYPEEIIHELQSNNQDELQQNVKRILSWISRWVEDNT